MSIFDDRTYRVESGSARDACMQGWQEILGSSELAPPRSIELDAGVSLAAGETVEVALGAAAAAGAVRQGAAPDEAEEEHLYRPEPGAAGAPLTAQAAEAQATPPAGGGPGNEQPAPDDSRRLTERIAPKLAEALAGAFCEFRQSTAGDRRRIDAALSAAADISRQLRSVSAELSLLRGQMERIGERLNAEEAERRQLAERLSRFEEGQQSHERRLEAQAGAIRALHATTSDRGGRREEFLATLRRLEEILGAFSQPVQLPEGL